MLHWLAILVLTIVVVRQSSAIRRLQEQLEDALEATRIPRRFATLPPEPAPRPTPVETPASAPALPPEPAPTPAPAAVAARSAAESAAHLPPHRRPRTPASEPLAPQEPEPSGRAAVSTWLAENGLAWIGGGGLALGGLLLVVYAAQQGVFTPPLRIVAAALLGVIMVGASEWILHQKRAPGGRHLLAAAVAAGAGAVTLYGAVCAAYTLYDLIPFPVAALLTAAISLGLLGLSSRHGEPLALLAMLGAILTPWVTGVMSWSPVVLMAYAVVIGSTGFALCARRRWAQAGSVTAVGLLTFCFAPGLDGAPVLILLAAIGPACAVLWRDRMASEAKAPDDRPCRDLFTALPTAAMAIATLMTAWLWLSAIGTEVQSLTSSAFVSGALVILGAASTVLTLIRPAVFAAPVGMAVLLSLFGMGLVGGTPRYTALLPLVHGLAVLIPAVALIAGLRMQGDARRTLLAIGAVGVAALASLSWPLMDTLGLRLAWAPAALLGAALFATAHLIASRSEPDRRNTGLIFWLAAAAELAFLSIHAAVPGAIEPLAFAGASLVLAVATRRLNWPGLAQAAVAGGLFSLLTLVRPDWIAVALEGRLPLAPALAIAFAAAAVLYLGARIMPRPDAPVRNEVEAQGTTALLVLMTGLFVGLSVMLAGPDRSAGVGVLFEGSLRTLLLLGAGLVLTVRQREDDGLIARWRTIVILLAGLGHALLVQVLAWNPWWGEGAPPTGLPVINTLLLSYLAPAGLLAACGLRWRAGVGWSRLWMGAALAFAFLWLLLVVRHLFHGAFMGRAPIGRAESCAYVVLLLAMAHVFARSRVAERARLTGVLHPVAVAIGWLALICAIAIFGFSASPWWGPSSAPLESPAHAILLFALYGAGAAGLAGLRAMPAPLDRAAKAASVGVMFALLALVIRWVFHGNDMSSEAPGGALETWTHSAFWALFGLLTLGSGTVRHDIVLRWAGLVILLVTAAKVLFFDLARLEGVIRAASFLAVGALFLAGALVARRLNARRKSGDEVV